MKRDQAKAIKIIKLRMISLIRESNMSSQELEDRILTLCQYLHRANEPHSKWFYEEISEKVMEI